jgi:hypothetical protein
MYWPVIHLASSDATKETTSPMSAGCPIRPNAEQLAAHSRAGSVATQLIREFTGAPG